MRFFSDVVGGLPGTTADVHSKPLRTSKHCLLVMNGAEDSRLLLPSLRTETKVVE